MLHPKPTRSIVREETLAAYPVSGSAIHQQVIPVALTVSFSARSRRRTGRSRCAWLDG